LERKTSVRTFANKERTEEESRTYRSRFEVWKILYGGGVQRMFS